MSRLADRIINEPNMLGHFDRTPGEILESYRRLHQIEQQLNKLFLDAAEQEPGQRKAIEVAVLNSVADILGIDRPMDLLKQREAAS